MQNQIKEKTDSIFSFSQVLLLHYSKTSWCLKVNVYKLKCTQNTFSMQRL